MSIKRITADTYFEATVRAEELYGKDNFEIIKSEKEDISSAFGLIRKEMVVLLVKLKEVKPSTIVTVAPTRPSESIDASKLKLFKEPINKPQPAVRETNSLNYTMPRLQATNAYARNNTAMNMRKVHGIRSNQGGDREPQSQRITETETKVDSLLEVISKVKETKARARIAVKGTQKKQAQKENSSDNRLDSLENKMEQILKMLQNTTKATEKANKKLVPEIPEGLYKIRENLLYLDTPSDVTDRIITGLKNDLSLDALQYPSEAYKEALSWLESKIRFEPDIYFKKSNKPKIIMLVGPTGVGKTTTIAKLSAHYGLSSSDRKSVALFTLDTYRIAAAEQLAQYAKIIDIDIEVILKPEDVETALLKHSDKDLIIVDTAGRGQKDKDEIRELSKFIDKFPNPEKYLVVSATSKYVDILDAAKSFSILDYDKMIFTKLDETNTVGPLLAILYTTRKPLSYITNGQGVPNDFEEANFSIFYKTLFQPSTNSKSNNYL